ncbi:hypothetical protein [uncultured Tateyamaria sp.]|uniref:hypothetical protein n=1 Tax=uncultured Tateyamaria sp. TaxID=455651 RepID=UPI0026218B7A|nr:hypothetical protein [uncultured Tateyamaria sp.]
MKRIFLSPLAAMGLVALCAATNAQQAPRYEAVWHQGQTTSLTTAPLSRSNFLETGQSLAESGLRLIDIETTIMNGRRVYAGLWTQGSGTNLFSGPLRPQRFRTLRADRRDQGLRLVDFEIFRTPDGERRYVGVWRNGTGREVLTRPLRQARFLARGEELTSEGLRLVDVEVERRGGRLLYSGLFRSGSGSNLITTPLSRPAFIQRRNQMVADGLELTDVERVRIDGQNRFVGVWSSGDGRSRLSVPREFGPFFIFAQEQFNDDRHTRDFEFVSRLPTGSGDPDPMPDPGPGPGPGSGGGGSTAALPRLPDWLELTSSHEVIVDFTPPVGEAGFSMTLPVELLPDTLPRNDAGDPVLPDNFCGVRLIDTSEVIWETGTGALETNFPYNHIPNMNGEIGDQPLEPFRLGGIDITGPIGGCAQDNEPWQFFFPITQDSTGGPPPARRLTVEMPGGEVEFLNFNIHAGEALDIDEFFSDEAFEQLVAIMESFADTQVDNGYCSGVSIYMEELCNEVPGLCPVASSADLPAC